MQSLLVARPTVCNGVCQCQGFAGIAHTVERKCFENGKQAMFGILVQRLIALFERSLRVHADLRSCMLAKQSGNEDNSAFH